MCEGFRSNPPPLYLFGSHPTGVPPRSGPARDPARFRPDLVHQTLLAIMDSPLAKAGRVRAAAPPGRGNHGPFPRAQSALNYAWIEHSIFFWPPQCFFLGLIVWTPFFCCFPPLG